MISRILRPAALAFGVLCASLNAPVAAQNRTPFDLDVILSLTGSGSQAADRATRSLGLLEADVNARGGIRGQPLHFVFHDDETNPALALQLVNGIISARHPAAVLGPVYASLCNAILPIVNLNGPVTFCISPSIFPAKGSYMFSAGPSQADLIRLLVRYFRERKIARVASITTTDAAGQDADRAILETFKMPENRTIALTDQEHFNPTDIDVSAQISRVRAAGADALIVWTSGAPAGTALRSIQQLGLNIPIGLAPSNMNYNAMHQYAGILPRELYFPGTTDAIDETSSRASQLALDRYAGMLKTAGIDRDMQTGTVWDPAAILVDALQHTGANATAQQVRDYILSLSHYSGISGSYNFTDGRQRGLSIDTLAVMRWDAVKNGWVAVSNFGGTLLK